jgi:16S rRNA (cytosine967-C5)-methyltransferase
VEVAESVAWLGKGGRPFDLILIDAPCSASGTFRKHPELNWIYKDADTVRLAQIQEKLLDAAISRLSPNGLLIYSVCSWLPEEGLGHLSRILSLHPRLKAVSVWPMDQGEGLTHIFRPDPLVWDGEGFQGFAVANEA